MSASLAQSLLTKAAFLATISSFFALSSCYQTEPKGDLLPKSFEATQPSDVPIPKDFSLLDEPGAAYSYEQGSFRWASARYGGQAGPNAATSQMKEAMGIHGWSLLREEALPGDAPGRRLEFERDRQRAVIQIFRKEDNTILQVDIRTSTD